MQTGCLVSLLRCPAAVFSLTMCMLLIIVFFLYTWTGTNVQVYIHIHICGKCTNMCIVHCGYMYMYNM